MISSDAWCCCVLLRFGHSPTVTNNYLNVSSHWLFGTILWLAADRMPSGQSKADRGALFPGHFYEYVERPRSDSTSGPKKSGLLAYRKMCRSLPLPSPSIFFSEPQA